MVIFNLDHQSIIINGLSFQSYGCRTILLQPPADALYKFLELDHRGFFSRCSSYI